MSQLSSLILVLLVTLTAGVLIWFFGKRADQQRVARFRERAPRDRTELWQERYRDQGVALQNVEGALALVGRATGVGPARLRPEDRFAVELAPERGWEFDDGLAEIYWDLEAKKKGSSEGVETVDDLIRRIDELDSSRMHQAPLGG